jgi:hypothetical protein
VALLVFKTSVGLNKVPGGFDSHPPPPFPDSDRPADLMSARVPQPRVDARSRDPEQHSFPLGFAIVLAAIALLVVGTGRSTRIPTVAGTDATEMELMKAFSSGGVQYASRLASSEPPRPTEDPVASAAALERWARQQANGAAATFQWRVRVDTNAKTPCPT